jgi:hypothetical protein
MQDAKPRRVICVDEAVVDVRVRGVLCRNARRRGWVTLAGLLRRVAV